MALQPYIRVESLEEYSERFKDFAHMERTEDGILLVRLHWKGGPVVWSYQTQHAYGELWTAIGHDKKNEVMILTCQDPYWMVHKSDPSSFDEVEDSTDTALKFNCNIPDTIPEGMENCCAPEHKKISQERAWTSPIWYTPNS